MRVWLSEGAELFNTLVNAESASVVREGGAWLFLATPGSDEKAPAMVRLVYSVAAKDRGDIALAAPRFSVPRENVTWRVIVPPGHEIEDHEGGFTLQDERHAGLFGLAEYRAPRRASARGRLRRRPRCWRGRTTCSSVASSRRPARPSAGRPRCAGSTRRRTRTRGCSSAR